MAQRIHEGSNLLVWLLNLEWMNISVVSEVDMTIPLHRKVSLCWPLKFRLWWVWIRLTQGICEFSCRKYA